MKPRLSYTIWFSQRTGSTLLCDALESTGVAGRPREWLLDADLLEQYGASDYAALQERLWEAGSTANRVFGLKFAFFEPHVTIVLEELSRLPGSPPPGGARAEIWHHAFPNSRHIFMTRRNKVRLAVSWWKAIQTEEWHRETGSPSRTADPGGAYAFDAINHLYCESVMREAGIQAFFAEAGIVPLTIVYEDLVQAYEDTVVRVLDYLDLDPSSVSIAAPRYQKMADEVSEEWVQRFREERQQGWQHRGW